MTKVRAALVLVLCCGTPSAVAAPSHVTTAKIRPWVQTGDMTAGRSWATATRLTDGRVLVAGGLFGTTPLRSAEIYDPRTGRWAATGSMKFRRFEHTAALLPNGDVLVAGGMAMLGYRSPAWTSEIYSPRTHKWRLGPQLKSSHMDGVAVTLRDGRVLLAGGASCDLPPVPGVFQCDANPSVGDPAEVFDLRTSAWVPVGRELSSDQGQQALRLRDGRVIVGCGSGPFEVFDPRPVAGITGLPGTWKLSAPDPHNRRACAMAPLPDGRVLVAGGESTTEPAPATSDMTTAASVYDPKVDTWTDVAPLPAYRDFAQAVTFMDGRVLVSGGMDDSHHAASDSFLFDPRSRTWRPAGWLVIPRFEGETTTRLRNGNVLVAGGAPLASNCCSLRESELLRVR